MARLPSLDELEARSYEADLQARQVRPQFRDNREPSTRLVAPGAPGRCWCGELQGHDWPGKAAGGAHPRQAPAARRADWRADWRADSESRAS